MASSRQTDFAVLASALVAGIFTAGMLAACATGSADPARPATPPGAPATTTPTEAAPAESLAAPAPPGPGDWDRWSHQQKLAYMKTTFLAQERTVFAGFEPVRYASLNCRTCHGAGANDSSYRMPNPDLPRLSGGADGFGELARKEPQALQFMQQVVVPETAKLLGVKAFDMTSHTGFSCFQCHIRS